MKRFFLHLALFFFFVIAPFITAQNHSVMDVDINSSPTTSGNNSIEAAWDTLFNYNATAVTGGSGNFGVVHVWRFGHFWTSRWNSNVIHIWNEDGTLHQNFTLPFSGTTGMVYDNLYTVYCANTSNTVYVVDVLTLNVVDTISVADAPGGFRFITYRHYGNSGAGSIIGGNWEGSLNFYEFSMTGTLLRTITNNILGVSGLALDYREENLWVFSQGSGSFSPQWIREMDYTTGTYTGVAHDVKTDIGLGTSNGIAGSLFFTSRWGNELEYINVLGGILQGTPNRLFGYELYIVGDPDELTSFAATAISNSEINLYFTPNALIDTVVIVWNTSGTFTFETGTPPPVGSPFAGGTLLYAGISSPQIHSGLPPSTKYYYKAFSYFASNYSPGLVDSATTQTSTNTFQLTVDVTNDWSMVSIPGLHPVDQNVNTWWAFRDPGADVFRFEGTYYSVTDATPGLGYWMKHSGDRTYNTGDEWPIDGIQIVAHDPLAGESGWNMIGGYELSVPTANVTTNPPGLQSGPIYKYSGGFLVASTLDPGYGYWINLNSAGQIIIPETIAKGTEQVDYFPDDWGKIILTDATGINYTLYAVKGEADLSQYELPPAPMAGMFDIRFSSGRIAEDINSALKTIEMSGVTYPMTVRVENMNIRLQDVTGKQINKNIKSGEDVVISDATIEKLMVSGELIPSVYSLDQNYPNPFNPSTKIMYSVLNAGQVTLKVFNAIGEEVMTLVNEVKQPGLYEVEFNSNGLPSGVYLYRITVGDPSAGSGQGFVATKKMILMK